MLHKLYRNGLPLLWSICFLLAGATWLAAPALNHTLSSRLTLISEYELPSQPYSWLFRLGDIFAALLLMLMSYWLVQRRAKNAVPRSLVYLLGVLGFMMLLDPIFSVTCHFTHGVCVEEGVTTSYFVHATETVLGAAILLYLSVHDAWRRRRLPSTLFVGLQVSYGLLYVSKLAAHYHASTLSQTMYQVISIIWIAWFVTDIANRATAAVPFLSWRLAFWVRRTLAVWAYCNGLLAILLSLRHIHIFGGFLKSIYFAGNTAWLAQHGVIVGVAMLYVSRHIDRGEHRARQLLLTLLFFEAIKYSVVTPHFSLLVFYWLTFIIVFALRPFFTRGSTAPTWHLRLQEIALVLSGVLTAIGIVAVFLTKNEEGRDISNAALHRFGGHAPHIALRHHHVLLRSSLLAHTITALLIAMLAFLLWSLFRPARQTVGRASSEEREQFTALLKKYAGSSEDFFKLWPQDKAYFWSADRHAAIAYKVSGSVVYALADPIAADTKTKTAVLQNLVARWHQHGYVTCFLMIPEASLAMYREAGLATIQIGSSAVIDTKQFAEETFRDKWWRWQRNRSTKAGYEYHQSVPPHDTPLIKQCAAVSRTWLRRPGHRERGFALGMFNADYLQQGMLHYLTDGGGEVVAFANEVPTYAKTKQATIDLMRFKPDANNAMPFLLGNIIISLATEDKIKYFDLGFVPLANMDNALIAIGKTLLSRQIAAAGLEQFKGKFKPQWHKNYVAYDGDLADLATIALGIEDVMQPE